MSKPPKIDRKQLKNPDEFLKKGTAFLDILAENRATLLGICIGIVVLVAGYEGYQWWTSSRTEKTWTSYNEAMKAPETQRWEKLKTVATEARGLRPGYFAEVALADHAYKEAEGAKDAAAMTPPASQAVDGYSRALEFKGLAPAEKQLVYINRGNAYELQSKFDEALKDYQAAAGIAGEANGYALLNEARAWELKKDVAKATSTYEKVISDFGGTEYAKLAKNYLRLMKSPLFQSLKPKAS